jgi:flagellar protein FliO/FliZ
MGKRYYVLACLAGLLFFAMAEPALAAEEAAQGGYLSGYETNVPQPAAMSWWSTAAYLVSLFVIFAFVVGMAYLAARFLGGHFAKPAATAAGRIVTHLPLGPNRSVCIVEMAGHFLLLGVTEHEITLLTEITDPEEMEKLHRMDGEASISGDMFSQQLGSLSGLAQKIPPFLRK